MGGCDLTTADTQSHSINYGLITAVAVVVAWDTEREIILWDVQTPRPNGSNRIISIDSSLMDWPWLGLVKLEFIA